MQQRQQHLLQSPRQKKETREREREKKTRSTLIDVAAPGGEGRGEWGTENENFRNPAASRVSSCLQLSDS